MNAPCASTNALRDTTYLERPRYFPRQMITATELNLEHSYLRDRFRRHNRLLHGWGVVCGAQVCLVPNHEKTAAEPWKVRVKPGYILGPYGDEIVIDTERIVDVRTSGITAVCGQPAGELFDPWCNDVMVERQEGPLYLAVRYEEIPSRPVRVQPNGCGCDDGQCEYSRWQDGYEIQMLPRCPESHHPSTDSSGSAHAWDYEAHSYLGDAAGERIRELYGISDCPSCPPDPWVVLAMIQISKDGTILVIDNCSCRRIVPSTSRLWVTCPHGSMTITEIDPVKLERGATATQLKITTTAKAITNVYAPRGVKVTNIDDGTKSGTSSNGQELFAFGVTVDVDNDAPLGKWMISVVSDECSLATHSITIIKKAT